MTTTSPHLGGLYDGFEAYRSQLPEDFKRTMRAGFVVPDTNVLLNLYRYTVDAREKLLEVMRMLGDRLWVPNHAILEFWRNRESVMRDAGGSSKVIQELELLYQKMESELRSWANRVYLPTDTRDDLLRGLNRSVDAIRAQIGELAEAHSLGLSKSTQEDSILFSLEDILAGRVGPPLTEEDHQKTVTEGLRRIANQEPPGYKDKNKTDNRAAGDYIAWEQTLREASRRSSDVLFITGDLKEDWWREEGGERRGPRPELVEELKSRAGKQLYMIRPSQLLEYAKEVLQVEVSEQSVRDAELVESLTTQTGEAQYGGWSTRAVALLLSRLASEARVQALVLLDAAANETGYVSRQRVYQIGGYPADRSLKGFTRPYNRITQDLRSSGDLDHHASDILFTVYNDDSPEFGWAAGFQINPDVLPLFDELNLTAGT